MWVDPIVSWIPTLRYRVTSACYFILDFYWSGFHLKRLRFLYVVYLWIQFGSGMCLIHLRLIYYAYDCRKTHCILCSFFLDHFLRSHYSEGCVFCFDKCLWGFDPRSVLVSDVHNKKNPKFVSTRLFCNLWSSMAQVWVQAKPTTVGVEPTMFRSKVKRANTLRFFIFVDLLYAGFWWVNSVIYYEL